VLIRAAEVADLDGLAALALRSKGHWGYDAEFLEACRAELTLAPTDLEARAVRVAEVEGRVAGFAAVVVDGARAELTDLFVDFDQIGRGVGRALWDDAVALATAGGAATLRIEADPHAEGWYLRRGAGRVGRVASGSIAGRWLPVLELALGH
jgi:GNAT superfamily N-acetyltransferase